jgi:hypothetical protein
MTLIAAKGENVCPAVEALAEQLIAFLDATTMFCVPCEEQLFKE